MICKELITCKACLDLVGPLIRSRVSAGIKMMVHCLGIVHFVKIGHRLHWEKDELEIRILDIVSKSQILSQSFCLKLQILVRNLLPLSCMEIICMTVEHFRCNAAIVFAVEI